jgi:hypothetical protein
LLLFLDEAFQSFNGFGIYGSLLSRNRAYKKHLDCQQQHDKNNECFSARHHLIFLFIFADDL